MTVSRDDLSYGTLDGHTVVVTDERGPDVRDVVHPTAAMLAQGTSSVPPHRRPTTPTARSPRSRSSCSRSRTPSSPPRKS